MDAVLQVRLYVNSLAGQARTWLDTWDVRYLCGYLVGIASGGEESISNRCDLPALYSSRLAEKKNAVSVCSTFPDKRS